MLRKGTQLAVAAFTLGIGICWILFFADKEGSSAVALISPHADSESTPSITTRTETSNSSSTPGQHLSSSVRAQQEHEQWVRSLVDALLRAGDAESTVSAALLVKSNATLFMEFGEKREFQLRVLHLMHQAADSTSYDSAMKMLALSACTDLLSTGDECDSADTENALQTMDPDNALVWVGLLADDRRDGSKLNQSDVLERMSAARRFYDYRSEIGEMLKRSIEGVRTPIPQSLIEQSDVRPTEELVTRALIDYRVPHLDALSEACTSSSESTVTSKCERIVQMMRRENNLFFEDYIVTIERHLLKQQSVDSRTVADSERNAAWQHLQALVLPKTQDQTSRLRRGDLSAVREVLIANGVQFEPPEGWVAPDAR